MKARLYILISGLIFSIICILQALRAFNQWVIQLNGRAIPVWPSWMACIATGLLAFWAFSSLEKPKSEI